MLDQLNIRVRLEDGSLWATVAELPGVFATGDTLEELRVSLQDGVALYLAEPGEEPPDLVLGTLSSETSASVDLAYA